MKKWMTWMVCIGFAGVWAVSSARGIEGRDERGRGGETRRPRWVQMDTDGDGLVNRDEFEGSRIQRMSGRFERLDQDGDGVVSRQEFENRRARMGFVEIDGDGDGVLSLDEFTAAQADRINERFAGMDVDGDGLLSGDEFRAAHKRRGGSGPRH